MFVACLREVIKYVVCLPPTHRACSWWGPPWLPRGLRLVPLQTHKHYYWDSISCSCDSSKIVFRELFLFCDVGTCIFCLDAYSDSYVAIDKTVPRYFSNDV